jgi:tripartite ATP-independent transporter DctM subunit
MSRIAMPSMRRYGYSESLAAGTVAAGGTLGILIPPSVIMVIYGNLTETDIGKLFIAGIAPGILGIALYSITIGLVTYFKPESGPPGHRAGWSERLAAIRRVGPVVVLFTTVLGGIYFGIFTPTEAAGVGAAGGFAFVVSRRALTWSGLLDVLIDTAETSGKLMIMIVGAALFANFINVAGMPDALAGWIRRANVEPIVVVLSIMLAYILLGCVLDGLSIILLTIPLLYPILKALGVDLVWFGILVVVAVEVGLITPPIGLNVFVMKSVMPDISVSTIFRGVTPFIFADLVRLAILVFVPAISLFLPSLMR